MFLDMMVQTEQTPNPNTLKFLPGKKVSEAGSVEFWKKDKNINVSLVKDILSLKGTVMVFLGSDFITVKKEENHKWDDLKRSVISQINDYYLLKKFRVTDERRWNAKGQLITESEATINLHVRDEEKMTVGIGNGPVNAIDSALRKALISFYPSLDSLKLTDYKVMILSPEKGTGAITRVFIESTDEKKLHWTTIGVSPNIIDASYNAIHDSITYKLFHDLDSQ